jgi:hypothetical protein
MNPFKHRFHPDHDNLTELGVPLPAGKESYTITREIQLQFTPEDPDRLAMAGWGDRYVGGVYRETITGLHKKAIHVMGTFRLDHASRIGVLNDGIQQ